MIAPIIIAAIAQNRAIGKDNKLLWHISTDLKRFKKLTLGQSIIMGHNTYQSIGRALPGRTTIVLSRQRRNIPGVLVVSSIPEAFKLAANLTEKCFVAGGEQIYTACLPYCEEMIITHVDCTVEGDAFFPEIKADEWMRYFEQRPEQGPKDEHSFSFRNYRRIR